ncbi:putative nuclear RNA export factor [Paratrimastix pyriformis]|uniref:Nuclear RNA export factor n=1 Tax=Paratrimastix pyriformis TaxID=342808 RepID=A0ABQ8UQD8_9EUKA|nr:putative nuclear RNA export factor [Paratrimastix pyriformis]
MGNDVTALITNIISSACYLAILIWIGIDFVRLCSRTGRHLKLGAVYCVFRIFLFCSFITRLVWFLLRIVWDLHGQNVMDVVLGRVTTSFFFVAFSMIIFTWAQISSHTAGTDATRKFLVPTLIVSNVVFHGIAWIFLILWFFSDLTKDGNPLYDAAMIATTFLYGIVALLMLLYGLRLYGRLKRTFQSSFLRRDSIMTLVTTIVCCLCFIMRSVLFAYRPFTGAVLSPSELFVVLCYPVSECIPGAAMLLTIRRPPTPTSSAAPTPARSVQAEGANQRTTVPMMDPEEEEAVLIENNLQVRCRCVLPSYLSFAVLLDSAALEIASGGRMAMRPAFTLRAPAPYSLRPPPGSYQQGGYAPRPPSHRPPPVNKQSPLGVAMKSALSRLYDPTTKCCNCTSFLQTAEMAALNIRAQSPFSAPNIAKLFFSILEEVTQKNLVELVMANNNIDTLRQFTGLHSMFPHLVHLSLENNKLKDITELRFLKHAHLEMLICRGNLLPLDETYRQYVKFHLVTLTLLDGVPLAGFVPPPEITAIGLPAPQQFYPMEPNEHLAQFITMYARAMDGDRTDLITMYGDPCCFSLTCDTNSVPRNQLEQWTKFQALSNNMLMRSDSEARVQFHVKTTKQDIILALKTLPLTSHSREMRIEFFPLFGTVHMLQVQGCFTEKSASGNCNRAYTASFICCPPSEDHLPSGASLACPHFSRHDVSPRVCMTWRARASRHNWPLMVLNHQLHIGTTWGTHGVNAPQPQARPTVPAVAPPPLVLAVPPPAQSQPVVTAYPTYEQLEEDKKVTVRSFVGKTGLKTDRAIECLAVRSWNFQDALQAFELVKPNLPPDYYS